MGNRPTGKLALPKYDRPPVFEIAIGVEFVPIPELGLVQLFDFHNLWKQDYPKAQTQPALPPSPPPDGTVFAGVGLRIGSGQEPLRLWMLTAEEHTLLQLQNDRLILNWRRLDGDSYPSYDTLRAEFEVRWRQFADAVGSMGELRPTLADVTFVNAIETERGAQHLDAVLTSALPPDVPGQLRASVVQYVSELNPREHRGQMYITAQPDQQHDKVVNLTLVTRVALGSEELQVDNMMLSLDDAHDAAVLGFTSLTTPEMHRLWGRTR